MYRYHTARIIFIILLGSILSLAFFNICYGLKSFPIYSWDEARHGVSAYEMIKNNNFIVNTYRNKIDYWNLKPPLSFWTTIAGFKLAGFNELGLRLFSAVFAMLTIIIVALFVNKRHGMLASVISTMSLATCTQFLINHSARTGDADSLFVFLFTWAVLSLLQSEENKKWLYSSAIAFSLSFLTKSWHAGNIAIIIGLYLIFSGQLKRISKSNWIVLSLCMFLPILAWVELRYQYDGTHFFKKMIEYDLLQRSSTTLENHVGGRFFYFEVIWNFFEFWFILLLGLIIIFAIRNFSCKNFMSEKKGYYIGIFLWIVIPLTLFSFAETKIRWYILPIYPALSILIGILSSKILQSGKLITKTILLFSILFTFYHYETEIQTYIHHPTPKLYLSLLQKIQGKQEFKEYNLFWYHQKKWQQNMVLAAELSDGLQANDGNFNDFLNSDHALLMIRRDQNSLQFIKSEHLTIVTSNKWGYIVAKEKKVK